MSVTDDRIGPSHFLGLGGRLTDDNTIASCKVAATLLTFSSFLCYTDKLALEHRSSNTPSFRRIQYILYDLKYLLGVKPEVWTDDLRKGFLHGYSLLLRLLGMMQVNGST